MNLSRINVFVFFAVCSFLYEEQQLWKFQPEVRLLNAVISGAKNNLLMKPTEWFDSNLNSTRTKENFSISDVIAITVAIQKRKFSFVFAMNASKQKHLCTLHEINRDAFRVAPTAKNRKN